MAAKKIVRGVLLLVAVVGAALWAHHWVQTGRWQQSTDNAYLRADIASITPRIAGEIIEVAVRDGLVDASAEVEEELVEAEGVADVHGDSLATSARTAASFASSSFRSATVRSGLRGSGLL